VETAEVIVYSITGYIINKLSTFKIDKFGKYINFMKKFKFVFNFIRFVHYMIKNNYGITIKLVGSMSWVLSKVTQLFQTSVEFLN